MPMRPLTAMYLGGMGSVTHNFHRDAMAWRGFSEAVVDRRAVAGRAQGGGDIRRSAGVPRTKRSRGVAGRIRDHWSAAAAPPGVTGLIVNTDQLDALELMADLAGTRSGVSEMARRDRLVRAADHAEPRGEAQRHLDPLRVALLDQLRAHDGDVDVRVTIIRGAGPCFSAGYDLSSSLMEGSPFYSAPGDGQWERQANDTWSSVWDLAKPVIAQVHGYAIAGATELASACDLVYVADDAAHQLPGRARGQPARLAGPHRAAGTPPSNGADADGGRDAGEEAVRAGFANRTFPESRLDEEVVAIAVRVAGVPSDLQQINKRSVHRTFDVWGARRRDQGGHGAPGPGEAHRDGPALRRGCSGNGETGTALHRTLTRPAVPGPNGNFRRFTAGTPECGSATLDPGAFGHPRHCPFVVGRC